MAGRVKSMLSTVLIWSGTFFFSGYFVLHALGLGGEYGYFSLDTLDAEIAAAETELEERSNYRQWLAHRVKLVSEDRVDADLLGELARGQGGLFAGDEIIITLE